MGAALTGAMEILDSRNGEVQRLSPLFSYFVTRGDPADAGPVSIKDALYSASRDGVCASELHEGEAGSTGPYTRADALREPSFGATLQAKTRRLTREDRGNNRIGYHCLLPGGTSARWRGALQRSWPLVVGFNITESYVRLRDGATSIEDVSRDTGGSGHAALVYGCDGPWFFVRDSRGSDFGSGGDFRLHETVVDSLWVIESWVLRTIEYDT